MNTTPRFLGIAVLVLSVSAVCTAPASAAGAVENPLKHPVSYQDLDLSRPAGAETLYLRIKSAAENVCAPLNGKQMIEKVSRNACVAGAVARAVKHVNEPILTRYYLTLNPQADMGTVLTVKR